MKKTMNRLEILRSLGYSSYRDYLASGRWTKIRRRVLGMKNRCLACGERAEEVHHMSYAESVLAGADLRPLVPVCKLHHAEIHALPTLEEANARLVALVGEARMESWRAAIAKRFPNGIRGSTRRRTPLPAVEWVKPPRLSSEDLRAIREVFGR